MDTSFIDRFAQRVTLASGWRRIGVALGAGLVGGLALAPINLIPAFVVSAVLLVWLIDGCVESKPGGAASPVWNIRTAAVIGWWFGFGYFLVGLWWLGSAFLVEAEQFAWALPFGVVGLPALLALFPTFGCVVARILWAGGSGRIFALATGLGLSEWLRAVILTGFPWNDIGMVLGGNLVLGQVASVIGLHGLTFLTVAIASAPATIVDSHMPSRSGVAILSHRYRPTGIAIFGVLLLALFGTLRLAGNPTEYVDKPRLRIVQPNLPQGEKFKPENGPDILATHIRLSDRSTSPRTAGISTVTHLFWPESPFPFLLSESPQALAQIEKFIPPGTVLVTGAARADRMVQNSVGRRRASRFFNSIHIIDDKGVITQTYDKSKLVPFGEYLPMAPLFRMLGLKQFVHVPGGFTAGSSGKTLDLPGIGVTSPLICYEAIFPGFTTARIKSSIQPRVLVNVTNDGWFGLTTGPYQHLVQARLRSIEEGLPMIRVANTGISAVIDPMGRILHSLPLGVQGVIDSRLPNRAPQTIFSKHVLAAPAMIALLFLVFATIFRLRVRA